MAQFGYWRDPLCLAAGAAYALNRWVIKPHAHSQFLHDHFNDLLLIPCALPLLLWLQRLMRLRSHDEPPRAAEIFLHWAVWSVLFELLGPRFLRLGTSDPLDVIAYAVGAAISWAWWQRRGIVATCLGRRQPAPRADAFGKAL